MDVSAAVIRKAKRRIKRQLTTSVRQARVYQEDGLMKYRVGPGQQFISFRVGKGMRLYAAGQFQARDKELAPVAGEVAVSTEQENDTAVSNTANGQV